MIPFEVVKKALSGRCFASREAMPTVPITEETLVGAEKRGDSLVYVPRISLNEIAAQHKRDFTDDMRALRDVGFMRIRPEPGWWVVGVGPFLSENVSPTPRRAPASVFVFACLKHREFLGRHLFVGVATTDCKYHPGGPFLHGDPFRTVAVWMSSNGIGVTANFENTLPKEAFTAYAHRAK